MMKIWQRRDSREGQSLVEFVLMLPLLLIVVAGVLDLGRLYFAYVAVTDVAGEGAGFASAFVPASGGRCPDRSALNCPRDNDPENSLPDDSDLRHLDCTCSRAYAATSGFVQGEGLDVVVTLPSTSTFGSEISVTVTYTHTLVTPILNAIVPGGSLPLRAVVTERVVDPSKE